MPISLALLRAEVKKEKRVVTGALDEAIERNDWDQVLYYFRQANRSASQFHHALFKSRQAKSAHYLPQLMHLFRQAGHTPNVVTYTIMLLWRMRWSLWEGMTEELPPPHLFDDKLTKTYLTALLQKGDTRLALELAMQNTKGLDEANAGMLIKQLAVEQDWVAVEQLIAAIPMTGSLLHTLCLVADAERAKMFMERFSDTKLSIGCTVRLIAHFHSNAPIIHAILDRCVDLGVKDVWRAALAWISKEELFARQGHTPASLSTLIEQSFGLSLSPPLAFRRLILGCTDSELALKLWQQSLPHTPRLDTVVLGHLLRYVHREGIEELLNKARSVYGAPLPPSIEQLALTIKGEIATPDDELALKRQKVREALGRRDWQGARGLLADDQGDVWPIQVLRLEIEAAAGQRTAFLELLPEQFKKAAQLILEGGKASLPCEIAMPLLKLCLPLESILRNLEICDLTHSGLSWIIGRLEGPSLLFWIERFAHPFTPHIAEDWLKRAVELGDLEAFQAILQRMQSEGMTLTAGVHVGMLQLARAKYQKLDNLLGLWARLEEAKVPIPIGSWELILKQALEEAEHNSNWDRMISLLTAMLQHPQAANFDAALAETLFDRLLDHCPMAQCQLVAKQLEQAGVRMGTRWRTILLEDAISQGCLEEARVHWGHLVGQRQQVPRLDLTLSLFDKLIHSGRFPAAHRIYRHLHFNRRFVVNRPFGLSLAAEHLQSFLSLLNHRIPHPSSSLLANASLAPREPIGGLLPDLLAYAHQHRLSFSAGWCQQALSNLLGQGDFGPARQLHLMMVTKRIPYDGAELINQVSKNWRNKW